MSEWLQHLTVTLVALAALVVIVRRVFGFLRPPAKGAACASCPSSKNTCAPSSAAEPPRSAPTMVIPYSALLRRRGAKTPG